MKNEKRNNNSSAKLHLLRRMKKILFVCKQNRLRSPTAESVFRNYRGVQVKSAGLDPVARNPLTSELIEWSDIIMAMEKSHLEKIKKNFLKS